MKSTFRALVALLCLTTLAHGASPPVALGRGLVRAFQAQVSATLAAVQGALIITPSGAAQTEVSVTMIGSAANMTVVFEATPDGVNWIAVNAVPQNGGAAVASVVNPGATPAVWRFDMSGYIKSRARISVYASGSVTIQMVSTAPGLSDLMNPIATLTGAIPAGTNNIGKVTTVAISTAPTMANPTITTATSTLLLAAGTYNYIEIDNSSASVTFVIRLDGGAITGVTPSSSNNIIVLVPNGSWHSPPNWTPSTQINVYQASGSSSNALTVISG